MERGEKRKHGRGDGERRRNTDDPERGRKRSRSQTMEWDQGDERGRRRRVDLEESCDVRDRKKLRGEDKRVVILKEDALDTTRNTDVNPGALKGENAKYWMGSSSGGRRGEHRSAYREQDNRHTAGEERLCHHGHRYPRRRSPSERRFHHIAARGRVGRGPRMEQYNRFGASQHRNITKTDTSRPVSSGNLMEIIQKSPSEAAIELGSLKRSLQAGLDEQTIDEKRQHLLWRALAFVCRSVGATETVTMLLFMVVNSKLFVQHLSSCLISLRTSREGMNEGQQNFIRDIMTVFKAILRSLPRCAADVKVPVTLLLDAVARKEGDEFCKEVRASVQSLNSQVDSIEKEMERKRQVDRISRNPPPDDFRQQAILPTERELQAGYQPYLRPHVHKGVYADADHYLDVQFRLLKEDFIHPLRHGITESRAFKEAHTGQKPCIRDVRLYENVRYSHPQRDFSGLCHCLTFRKLKRVQWNSSKRLIYGSLLILSADNFKSFFFATVANRDAKELEAGRVAVSLVDKCDASCLKNKTFLMAESSVFFEAYRPVLLGLQRMSADFLPFSRYTLSLSDDIRAPPYLQDLSRNTGDDQLESDESRKIDISCIIEGERRGGLKPVSIDLLNDDAWPENDEVQLDNSQLEAVKSALTKEISVIQGPPGTGKTYVGLKIIEILLRNRNVWSRKCDWGPILLVCYTNHALDQFLEGILKFQERGIVRVGNRSKSDRLKHLTLNRMLGRRSSRERESVDLRLRHVEEEVDAAREHVERIEARLHGTENGIISECELKPFMSSQHHDSLMSHSLWSSLKSWMVDWLLCEVRADRDWNQSAESEVAYQTDIIQQRCEPPDKEDGEIDEDSINVEHERMFIEAQRMIDDGLEERKIKKRDDMETENFLGLDLNDLKKPEDRMLKRFIAKKLLGTDTIYPHIVDSISNVWHMHPHDRWALYHQWLVKYILHLKRELAEHEESFKKLCFQRSEARDVQKVQVLRKATIIGMTTTGAANHQQVLQRVKPKIVVVEEAAEVLEAHIVTSLNTSCQQLILIGDHQQLRPKPNVYMLAKKYHLDVSLFERLINNGFPYTQLKFQHRMRPELSALMRKHFYNVLHDHDSVKTYGHVRGVQRDIFFIDHTEPEDSMEDTMSHFNSHEVKFVVALCDYLLEQGYNPNQITILTAYAGQLLHFKKQMYRSKFAGVRVTTIDNYQGEENDIILSSFVRSNAEGQIGFLGISNRVCVSLSRAKQGMYCVGNFTLLAEKSDLWKEIVSDLKSTGCIGDCLQLQCTNHPENKTAVKTYEDFSSVPHGGCMEPCDARLDCGHVCRLACHPTDQDHTNYRCEAPCHNTICERNHPCPKKCGEDCPVNCFVQVEKVLPCKHKCTMECSSAVTLIKCGMKVKKELRCSHTRLLLCHMSTVGLEQECEVIVDKLLPCGHHKREKCNENGECHEVVTKLLKCNHSCSAKCFQEPDVIECKKEVEKTLPCGHTKTLRCHRNVDNVQCHVITTKQLECGHEIIGKCYQISECLEPVERKLDCGHTLTMPCSADVMSAKCISNCCKKLSCGHVCQGKCGRPCVKECSAKVKRNNWSCRHKVTVKCSDNPDSCYIACGKALPCGHICKGTCGKCYRGRYHLPCAELCKKELICGHTCPLECGVPCRPCGKKCPRRCFHGHCNHPCYAPCDRCTKRCTWKCEHYECSKLCCEPCDRPPCDRPCPKKTKCGHPCIGLCGEACPSKCRICDRAELELWFRGTVYDAYARHIQLEDCGHIFEVTWLDSRLGLIPTSKPSVTLTKLSVKCCPLCKKQIFMSRRYGNLLKASSATLQKVVKMIEEHEQSALSYDLNFWCKCSRGHVIPKNRRILDICMECVQEQKQTWNDTRPLAQGHEPQGHRDGGRDQNQQGTRQNRNRNRRRWHRTEGDIAHVKEAHINFFADSY